MLLWTGMSLRVVLASVRKHTAAIQNSHHSRHRRHQGSNPSRRTARRNNTPTPREEIRQKKRNQRSTMGYWNQRRHCFQYRWSTSRSWYR